MNGFEYTYTDGQEDALLDLKAEVWVGLKKLREILKASDPVKARTLALEEIGRLQDAMVRGKQDTFGLPKAIDPEE